MARFCKNTFGKHIESKKLTCHIQICKIKSTDNFTFTCKNKFTQNTLKSYLAKVNPS